MNLRNQQKKQKAKAFNKKKQEHIESVELLKELSTADKKFDYEIKQEPDQKLIYSSETSDVFHYRSIPTPLKLPSSYLL